MPLTIIQAPYRTRGIAGNFSLWNGLFNPMIFKGLRADFQIQNIYDQTTQHTIWALGTPADLYTAAAVGKKIYIRTNNYDAICTVKSVVQASSYQFVIRTEDLVHAGDDAGGHINFLGRANYYVQFRVRGNPYGDIDYTFRKKTDLRGEVIVDVSAALKGLLAFKNDFLYDVINRGDNHLGDWFKFNSQEFWDGSDVAAKAFNRTFWFINGGKQLGDDWGANYAEYVPFSNMYSIEPAKFLTKFEQPVYWEGYPFDLSFIYDSNLTGWDLVRQEHEKDINGITQSTTLEEIIKGAYSATQSNLGRVNRMMLRGDYGSGVKSIDVSVRIYDRYSDSTYGADDYHDDYWILEERPTPDEVDIVGALNVKIGECTKVPMYLCWLNSLGGWDYWLFDKVQEVSQSVFDDDTYNPDVIEIETAESREDFIGKRSRLEVKLGANNLTLNEVNGIRGLLSSPKSYVMEADGSRQVVLVKKGTFSLIRTDVNRGDIELTIERQEEYLQSNL